MDLYDFDTKELVKLTPAQTFVEITLCLPWLLLEIIMISQGYYILALPFAFYFFLTGLRQVHGGYHLTLGISKKHTDLFLFIMSLIMLGSMHAIKFNHLLHHKYNLSNEDIEAKSAHMKWWQALCFGPKFPLILHQNALKKSSASNRKWVIWEIYGNIAMISLGLLLYFTDLNNILLIHCALMIVGQCLTAFFAVWTVHHDCDEKVFARTQRGRFKNFISYNMFLHMEHHLFPNIPQRNLPKIAALLEGKKPELRSKKVF